MHVLVAYSRPRGTLGRYFIVSVMIYFSEATETAGIAVERDRFKYSCQQCGRWASIRTYETHAAAALTKSGRLELYRYDRFELDDHIRLILKDSELLLYQETNINLAPGFFTGVNHRIYNARSGNIERSGKIADHDLLYNVILLNWDTYINEHSPTMRVEEELIRQTMNAEQITIKELLLEPKGQPLEIEGQKHFIDAELRYLNN